MAHDSFVTWFVFPAMPLEDRRLVLDLGELLVVTAGHYREHLATQIRLLQDASRAEDVTWTDRPGACRCRVLPFRRLT